MTYHPYREVYTLTINEALISVPAGTLDFETENLITTGTVESGELIVDNITIDGALITSDTGAISFGNENLTTTGELNAGDVNTATLDVTSVAQFDIGVTLGTALATNSVINFIGLLGQDASISYDGSAEFDFGTKDLITTGTFTAGEIIDSGLTASVGVYTDGSKQLTSTAPTSGALGYWDRTGTVLSPGNSGDDVEISGDLDVSTINLSGSTITTSSSSLRLDAATRIYCRKDVFVAGDITLTGTVDGIDIATDVSANTTHRTSTGADHSYIDQDVTNGANPSFGTLTAANIIDSGLTASVGVYTDGSKQLTSTPPTSGALGYWNRAGTVISPANSGDDIVTTGDIQLQADIKKILLGASPTGDVGISFDGSNLLIDLRSGSGECKFSYFSYYTFDDLVEANGGLSVYGNIGVSGTVDGRDVAADGTTLDDLPVANLNSGTGASATTFWRGDGSWVNPISDPIYCSTVTNNDTTAAAGATRRNVFSDTSYSGTLTHDTVSNDIIFTQANGRFTIKTAGVYAFTWTLNGQLSSPDELMLEVKKNGGAVLYLEDTFIHSSVDPAHRTVSMVHTFAVDDYLTFAAASTDGVDSFTGHAGTNVIIHKL